MTGKPRYVFDTNTVVSAFLFHQSTPGQALAVALDQGGLLLSDEVASELGAVLRRDRFDAYVSRERREELLRGLIRDALLIKVTERIEACRDSSDNKFLELAISGGAACIVSGDDDLLVLDPYRGTPILNARAFLQWIRT